VLYRFTGSMDGSGPGWGDLAFDQAGNLYGTTSDGGSNGHGSVYELTPSDESWTEKILYSFTGGEDGSQPESGVILIKPAISTARPYTVARAPGERLSS